MTRRPARPPATVAGELLKPAEVAEVLRTTAGTLRNWRYLGTGPAYVKPGGAGRVLYRRSDVDAYIASQPAK